MDSAPSSLERAAAFIMVCTMDPAPMNPILCFNIPVSPFMDLSKQKNLSSSEKRTKGIFPRYHLNWPLFFRPGSLSTVINKPCYRRAVRDGSSPPASGRVSKRCPCAWVFSGTFYHTFFCFGYAWLKPSRYWEVSRLYCPLHPTCTLFVPCLCFWILPQPLHSFLIFGDTRPGLPLMQYCLPKAENYPKSSSSSISPIL